MLLETMISLPLYLMLIGGSMWIGELILAKQQLIIGDRYAAWNLGNMHRGGPGGVNTEVQDHLFPPDVFADQTSLLLPGFSTPTIWPNFMGRWWDAAYATVYLNVKMKPWAEGWLAGSSEVFLDEPYPDKNIFFMTGREEGISKNHVVIMRTFRSLENDYPRNWEARALAAGAWSYSVYNEAWHPDTGLVLTMNPPAGTEYPRYPPYEEISE